MERRTKYSLFCGITWLLFFAAFVIVLFTDQGFNSVGITSQTRVLSAVLFFASAVMGMTFVLLGNKEQDDERTREFQRVSAVSTLIIVMLYVYIINITLFIVNESTGNVAVEWFWFIANSAIFIVNIVFHFSYVIISLKGSGYEN